MRLGSAKVLGAAVVALTGMLAVAPSVAAKSAPDSAHVSHITLNGSRVGPAFQGAGALSGGGGNSRLLIEYPPTQRQQILDYLFKPGYGADLQILKLEIGGDAYATDGSEVSIEQTKGAINCNAGYEWWLAKQAVALNPDIQLYGLQWNAPGWVGGGAQEGWTSADIGYIIDWLNCAKQNGLTVKYIGGWNEHLPHGITPSIMQWFINLRAALNANGFTSTQIAATDSFAKTGKSGDVADFLAGHPQFDKAIGVLAYHNLCRYPATGNNCLVPEAARKSGKPIWESEIGALRETTGVPAMARSLINAFIQVDATGMIEWPLLSSMPANLPEEDRGLVFAPQPWSGHYSVFEMAWVLAQTTEFTEPGWHHIGGASGQLGGDYGSYTSYESPSHNAWSLVTQTTEAPRDQTITVHVDSGLPDSAVHVWSTRLNSTKSSTWFFNRGTVHPKGGTFSYTLQPDFIYSFTTTTGQHKGGPKVPGSKTMPLPYTATPDQSNEPTYLAPQDGSFEYLPGSTTTFEQTTVGQPVFWQNPVSTRFPYAVMGDRGMKNYTVSDDVTFTATGQNAGLISRFDHPKADGIAQRFYAYQFTLTTSGGWKMIRNASGKAATVLASGTLSSPPTLNSPVTMSLTANGSKLTAKVNGTTVKSLTDRTYATGDAGISTGGWYQVQFSNLKVTPVG
jgi:hypothetical protein